MLTVDLLYVHQLYTTVKQITQKHKDKTCKSPCSLNEMYKIHNTIHATLFTQIKHLSLCFKDTQAVD